MNETTAALLLVVVSFGVLAVLFVAGMRPQNWRLVKQIDDFGDRIARLEREVLDERQQRLRLESRLYEVEIITDSAIRWALDMAGQLRAANVEPSEMPPNIKRWIEAKQLPYNGKEAARIKIAGLIQTHFNNDELSGLCFELDLRLEDLPGDTHDERVRALVAHAERHGQMLALLTLCRAKRPRVIWPEAASL